MENLGVPIPSHWKVDITFRSWEVLVDRWVGISWRFGGHWTWERGDKEGVHFGQYSFRKMRNIKVFSCC